jgi:hypothetical protein
MGKKITGRPRFDVLQLMNIKVDRIGDKDKVEAAIAYLDTSLPPGHGMCGSFTASSERNHLSEKSLSLVSQLATSLEEDVAQLLFNEPKTEESKQEGIHDGKEPKGIVDAAEDASQV